MAKIQVSRTVKFSSKAGTYNAMLQSSRGLLWQSYQGDAASPVNIVPSFITVQPVLSFVVISSRGSGTTAINGHPTWSFGGTVIPFDSQTNLSTGATFAGKFQRLAPADNNGSNYGLKILTNLVDIAQGSSVTIKAVGSVVGANFSDEVYAEHTINIYPQTSSSAQIDIIDVTQVDNATIGRNFTFDEDGQSITMKVETYVGGVRVDSDSTAITTNQITYQWQKVTNGSWANISGQTSQTLTITEGDVQTYSKYRCEVRQAGVVLGYGRANIMDSTDPFIINPNPSPEDETIENESDTVTYTPQIVSRKMPTTPVADYTNAKFNFMFSASDGVTIQTVNNAASAAVTYAMCESNGDIDVTIETVDDINDY